jgi:hypothetical protein
MWARLSLVFGSGGHSSPSWSSLRCSTFLSTLKITIVERLFQVGHDKLMMIPTFVRCYEFLMSWRVYLETLAVWQAMLRWARAIKERGHRMLAFGKNWLASLKRKGWLTRQHE